MFLSSLVDEEFNIHFAFVISYLLFYSYSFTFFILKRKKTHRCNQQWFNYWNGKTINNLIRWSGNCWKLVQLSLSELKVGDSWLSSEMQALRGVMGQQGKEMEVSILSVYHPCISLQCYVRTKYLWLFLSYYSSWVLWNVAFRNKLFVSKETEALFCIREV